MKFILSLILGVLLCSTSLGVLGNSCQVSLSATARAGGLYQSGDGWLQIFDLVLANTGSCGVNSMLLYISAQNITQTWNLLQESGDAYSVTSFGSALPLGASVNAGFIAFFGTQSQVQDVIVLLNTTSCSACPSSSTSSSSSSSSATTSSAATTSGSTVSITTSSSTGSPSSCAVSSTLTARAGGSWQTGNDVSQIYDLVILNNGNCGANDIPLQITLPSGASISSSWNIELISGSQYSLTSFGSVLPVGASVSAGFIALFPNTQQVPAGVLAALLQTTCNSCASGSSSSTASSSSSSSSSSSVSATTSSAATTSGSVSTTTSSSTGALTCALSAILTPRAGSSYQSGNGISQIYDFSVSNGGPCAASLITLAITLPSAASISSAWNIQLVSGIQYTLTNFGGSLLQGQSASAGFIVFFPNTQIVPAGVSLALGASQCAC